MLELLKQRLLVDYLSAVQLLIIELFWDLKGLKMLELLSG